MLTYCTHYVICGEARIRMRDADVCVLLYNSPIRKHKSAPIFLPCTCHDLNQAWAMPHPRSWLGLLCVVQRKWGGGGTRVRVQRVAIAPYAAAASAWETGEPGYSFCCVASLHRLRVHASFTFRPIVVQQQPQQSQQQYDHCDYYAANQATMRVLTGHAPIAIALRPRPWPC